jgi:hypothetical protein
MARRVLLRGVEKSHHPAGPKELAMMFAFVIALFGVAVLGTMNLVAAS